jgi:hypothetical protein
MSIKKVIPYFCVLREGYYVIIWLIVRDRPFNLKEGGGYGFLFRSGILIRTTQEEESLFFMSRPARNFLQNLTLDYMTKTLNHIIFFFLHQNQNIFFSNIGNKNIFLEKKT